MSTRASQANRKLHRRLPTRSTISSMLGSDVSLPPTPLRERSTNKKDSATTTATSSSFIPELNSTPPMPTFQKCPMALKEPAAGARPNPLGSHPRTPRKTRVWPADPVPCPSSADDGLEPVRLENLPPRSRGGVVQDSSEQLPTSVRQENYHQNANGHSESSPPRLHGPQVFHTTSIFNDRFQDTGPLPTAWTQRHDRAICVLDARDYGLVAIVTKMRKVFPELIGILTPAMVDKRLQILDQRVELDYWQVGLRSFGTAAAAGGGGGAIKGHGDPTIKPTRSSNLAGSQTKENFSSRGASGAVVLPRSTTVATGIRDVRPALPN